MRIRNLETFILHVPVTRGGITDSTHPVTLWGASGVIIHTESGLCGYGYTGTHGHRPTDRLITDCIAETYGPMLAGEDAHEVHYLWNKLLRFAPVHWVGRCGITHLALSAVDIALWDLKAKAAGMSLWKLLGRSASKKLEAYNMDGGWLNWSMEELICDTRRLVEDEGYACVKIKIGSDDPHRDLDRIEAVRRAIGTRVKLMVDANGK